MANIEGVVVSENQRWTGKRKAEAVLDIIKARIPETFHPESPKLFIPNPRNFSSVPFRVPVTSAILRSETEEWILASKI
jgi:hypothetical protein